MLHRPEKMNLVLTPTQVVDLYTLVTDHARKAPSGDPRTQHLRDVRTALENWLRARSVE